MIGRIGLLCIALMGCTVETGPGQQGRTGETGAPGPQGPAGDAGASGPTEDITRNDVYSTTNQEAISTAPGEFSYARAFCYPHDVLLSGLCTAWDPTKANLGPWLEHDQDVNYPDTSYVECTAWGVEGTTEIAAVARCLKVQQ